MAVRFSFITKFLYHGDEIKTVDWKYQTKGLWSCKSFVFCKYLNGEDLHKLYGIAIPI